MLMNMLNIALEYLNYGWSIIPFQQGSKRPLIAWLEFQQRQPSVAEVSEWFNRWPRANIGIVTGKISNLLVLDIDTRHDGKKSLTALEKQHGELPGTVEVVTGGGGRHLYFSHPGGQLHNKVAIFPGIDIRADGGCVVAPPSLHASGKQYQWRKQHAPQQMSLAALPKWLLKLAYEERKKPPHSLEYWQELIKTNVMEGERNNTITSLCGYLLWHGLSEDIVMELLLCWNRERCNPPLPDDEVIQIVESISRLHH